MYTRDLIKAVGIRFVLKVTGRAGKFSVVPLLLNLGSGVGLLAIVSTLFIGVFGVHTLGHRFFILCVLKL